MQSAGPFTLQPGAVNEITTGVVWARAKSGGQTASIALVKIYDKEAQQLFEEAQHDTDISMDAEHFRPNMGLIAQAYQKVLSDCQNADLVLSDSCTCTKEWAHDSEWGWYKHADKNGTEFWETVNPKGEYVPKWGNGLKKSEKK